MTRGRTQFVLGALYCPYRANKYRDELIGFRGEAVHLAAIGKAGLVEDLKPVGGFVELLQCAFHLADEIRIRFRASGFAVMRSDRCSRTQQLASQLEMHC